MALLVAFVIMAATYGVIVPVFEAADEHTHYFVAQHIAETGRLPVQAAERPERGPWEQEGSQPPLYYALVAPLVRVSGAALDEADLRYNHQNTMGEPWHRANENRFVHDPRIEGFPWRGHALAVHLARLASTLLAAAAVAGLFGLALRIVPTRPWLAWAAAALFAFNPQHLHLAGALTNDNAMNALAAVTLWLLARILDGHSDRPTRYGLAVAVGLAPLAKLSGLALVGFAGLTVAWIAWRRRDMALFVGTAIPIAAATLVLSGWWYGRNLQLYGTLTGWNLMLPEGIRRDFHPERWLRGLPAELYGLWRSSWGLFGWFTIMLPEWVYRLLEVACLTGLAAAAFAWRRAAWIDRPRLLWLVCWWAIVFGSLLRWLTLAKGAHGRLLFPAVAAPLILLVFGWRTLAPRRIGDRAFALGVAGAMLAFSIGSLAGAVAPAFARPVALDAAPSLDAGQRVDATFGDSLRLIGVEHPERATEGDRLPVRLYWELVGRPERDGLVAIRLDQSARRRTKGPVGPKEPFGETEIVTVPGATSLAYPGRGTTPPDLLPAILGDPPAWAVDDHVIPVPAVARADESMPPMPIAARASIHVYDREAGESWPVASPADPAATDVSRTIVIDPAPQDRLSNGRRPPSWPMARFDGAGAAIALYLATAGPDDIFLEPDFDLTAPPPSPPPAGADGTTRFPSRRTVSVEIDTLRRPSDPPRFAVRVVWRASGPVPDLARFTHVVDERGALVEQFDGEPASHGPYPSRYWRPDEMLVADVPWDLPPDATPGATYTVRVGLYPRAADAPALRATTIDGAPWPGDAVTIVQATFVPDGR